MTKGAPDEKPSMKILVLDESADEYVHCVAEKETREYTFVTSPDDAGDSYDVLLAQPDFAAAYLRGGGKVDWIQSTWAGVAPVLTLAEISDIKLTGVKEIFGGQIAEYVFAYLLAAGRRIEQLRSHQSAREWSPIWPDSLTGKTMVILGTGSIGSHVARIARAFSVRTVGVSRSGRPVRDFDDVHPVSQLARVVPMADVLLIALPGTDETAGLVDHKLLSLLKSDVTLINVGRGSVVDEAALAEALQAGRLQHAVLDVFQTEPLPRDSPLWRVPGAVITPHIAAVSYPVDVAAVFNENLDRYEHGDSLLYLVDPGRGY